MTNMRNFPEVSWVLQENKLKPKHFWRSKHILGNKNAKDVSRMAPSRVKCLYFWHVCHKQITYSSKRYLYVLWSVSLFNVLPKKKINKKVVWKKYNPTNFIYRKYLRICILNFCMSYLKKKISWVICFLNRCNRLFHQW